MAKQVWLIDRFFGGLADAEKEGPKGAFLYGDRLDFKTDPSALGVNIKTTKDSASVITDLPKWIEHDPTNDKTYAYGNDGNFYQEIAGTWSALTTPTTAVGQGMKIWNDYVYLRKTSAFARYGPLSGAASLTQSWQSANVQTENDHAQIEEFQGNLYACNGRFLAEWDGATFTYNKITLPIGWKLRCMAKLGEQLVIGGWQGSNVYDFAKGFLWFWNGTDTSITSFLEISEGAINAMTVLDNNLYFVAGSIGNVYVYTGNIVKLKQISNLLGRNEYIDIYPGAITPHQGNVLIGVGGLTNSSTIPQGVYSYGRLNKNYPRSMNIDHIISAGTTTGTTLKIGALHSVGPNEFYLGWENGTTSNGIDKISGSTPYASSTWQSLIFDNGSPYRDKQCDLIKFTFKPLAANESITFYYKKDRAVAWTSLGTANTTGDTEKNFPFSPDIVWKDIQIRADLETTGSTYPELLSSAVSFSERRLF